MAQYLLCALCAILSYLLGSVNTSMIISKFLGKDVRKEGSGNAGATNTLRVFGKKAAVIVLIGDALKAVIALIIARFLSAYFTASRDFMTPVYVAAFFVVLGHNFPVYFGFKGGKGVMTSAAVIFMLDWRIGLVVLTISIIVMAITKFVSLGSCIGSIIFPLTVIIFHTEDIYFIILSVLMGALALFMHRANIVRLINRTESKLSFGKK